MTGYEVLRLDALDDLVALRDDWEQLLAMTPQATFFQSLDWLTPFWRHAAGRHQPRVLVVARDGHRIGILPLSHYTEKSRLGPVRVLGYPLDNWGTSFGPVGAQPDEILVAALSWLRGQPRDWEMLDLGWAEGPLALTTATALQEAGLAAALGARRELSWVDLTDGWDAYWSSRTSKLRNNVRRSEKQLAAIGRLHSIHCRPTADNPRWDLYQQCEQVAASSWQATVATGNTLSAPTLQPLLREVHRAAVSRTAVAMNLLMLDDWPIAFSYDYVFQQRVYGLRTGFDPALARTGPGTVLLARSLRDYCARGDRTMDLGETPSAYKAKWRTRTSDSTSFRHYSPSAWRAQVLRWKHQIFDPPPGVPVRSLPVM